jgi:hypothetical protein
MIKLRAKVKVRVKAKIKEGKTFAKEKIIY